MKQKMKKTDKKKKKDTISEQISDKMIDILR